MALGNPTGKQAHNGDKTDPGRGAIQGRHALHACPCGAQQGAGPALLGRGRLLAAQSHGAAAARVERGSRARTWGRQAEGGNRGGGRKRSGTWHTQAKGKGAIAGIAGGQSGPRRGRWQARTCCTRPVTGVAGRGATRVGPMPPPGRRRRARQLSAAIRHHAHPRVRGWSQGGRPSARGKPAKGGIWRQPGAPAGWQAHGAWGRERGQPGCHSNGTKTCMHAHMGARAGPGMLPAAAFLARCKARCRGCPRGSSTMLGRGVRVEGGPVRPARRRPWSDRCRASAQLSAGCAAMLRRESRPW